MVRAHAFFSGTVQGVGFRYTASGFARELHLTGWVKNLSDGRVEMVAEGPQKAIEELLARLEKYFNIDAKHVEWLNYQEAFKGFSVTY